MYHGISWLRLTHLSLHLNRWDGWIFIDSMST
jgi:hypothetical protein